MEKLRKLSVKAFTVCMPTSAVFFTELFHCLRTFTQAFHISPHRLNGVAMVFPVLSAAAFAPCVNFPISIDRTK